MEERIYAAIDLENLLVPARRDGQLQAGLDEVVCHLRRLTLGGRSLGGVAVGDADLGRHAAWPLGELGIRVHVPALIGPDAADLDLIGRMRRETPETANTLIIGSGDHAFAPVATEFGVKGFRIVVLARPGSISHELFAAAHHFEPLELDRLVPTT